MAKEIILGIDPGIATTGYGLIKQEKNHTFTLVNYGCIFTEPNLVLSERLKIIYNDINSIIKKYKPSIIAVEELFFCKNAKTALTVGHSRGIILLCAIQSELPIKEFTPLEVKQGVTGYGKADKKQVQKMIRVILKMKDIPNPDDAADALAIAITAANFIK